MTTELLTADPDANPLAAAVAARDRDTVNMVEAAVAGRNAFLVYQPVMIASRPQEPAFFEGLIRVMDATGRVIPARDFIGAVEMTDTGRRIDCLALELGLMALRTNSGLRLAINMSARSIGYRRWQQTLADGLGGDRTVGERLILEITEASAMIMPEVVQAFMSDCQAKGVSFALDDFGAGYTAFRHLRDMYFDIVKIDGQFIRGIAGNRDNQVLAEALVKIGQHFEMLTVAESVEGPDDAAWLTAAGVDCLQGYHFGAPTRRTTFQTAAEGRAVG